MDKEQFLNELRSRILSLTDEERNEALQYYSDYFDEAGDDEKVIKELGSPDDVAKTIIEKFASAPAVQAKKPSSDDDDGAGGNPRVDFDDALYFSFDREEVKNLSFEFSASSVVMVSGKRFEIETRGISENDFSCRLDSNGTLFASNSRKIPAFGLFSHDRKLRVYPRILISIPENASVYSFCLKAGVGSVVAKDIKLSYQSGNFEVGAGNLVLKDLTGSKSTVRCGMGNLEISGSLKGKTKVDCGMGNVALKISGNLESYSYDCKVGLGEVRLNDRKLGVVAQVYAQTVKENHLSVNCGMGSVNVEIR